MKHKRPLLLLLALFPAIAQAHVQWFVTPEEMKNVTLPLDMVSLWLTVGVLICVVTAILLTRFSYISPITENLISVIPKVDRRIYMAYFMTLINTFFVMILLKGLFLAPNLALKEFLIPLGVLLQAAIIVCTAFSVSLAGIALLITTGVVLIIFPLSVSINYVFELGAIGIFMVWNGPITSAVDQWIFHVDKSKQFWKLSVRILRMGIGLQLIILALTEKLIHPGLGLVFVEKYPFYNFFITLGLEQVTNLHFIYFIGISEFALGTLLMFGIASRIVLLTLAAAFTTTAIIHGIHEILGHLPIFAAAVILLLECVNKSHRPDK